MPFESQFHIWIDPTSLLDWKNPPINPKAWENEVRTTILKVSTSKVGRAVLNNIRHYQRIVRIVPSQNESALCTADEATTTRGNEDAMQARLNSWIWSFNGLAGTKFKGVRGKIVFTPSRWSKGGACQTANQPASQYTPTPDEVLLHELVHAARVVSLKYDPQVTSKGLLMYDDDEEFFAVLVETIYQSELKKGVLRASHTGFLEMDKNLQSSLEFFQVSGNAFEMVKQFATENSLLATALSHIEVPFNPLNAFFCHTAKAREMSRSSYAKVRDLGPVGMIFAPLLK